MEAKDILGRVFPDDQLNVTPIDRIDNSERAVRRRAAFSAARQRAEERSRLAEPPSHESIIDLQPYNSEIIEIYITERSE